MALRLTKEMIQQNKGKIILWDDKKEKFNSCEAYIIGYDGEVKAEGFGWNYKEAKVNALIELEAKIKDLELCFQNDVKVID